MWKGFVFCGLLAAISYNVNGQAIGAEAGFTMSSLRAKIPTANTNNLIKPGFRAGICVDNYADLHLTWQYGLYYTAKGGFLSYDRKYTNNGSVIEQEFNGFLRIDYVEVPLSLLYRSYYRNGGHFFAGGGPYAAAAFGGLIGYENNEFSQNQRLRSTSVLLPISIGNMAGDLIRVFDAGLQGQLGYEIRSGFFARAYGSYGMLNISPSPLIKLRNANFGLSIGYMLR